MSTKDFDNFEYNKTYNLRREHRWDSLKEKGKIDEFRKVVQDMEIKKPFITTCQYEIEKTGQIGTMI